MINDLQYSASPASGDEVEPFFDLAFPVAGKYLPADHGYALLASITKRLPQIRQYSEIGILTIPGLGDRQGKILLTSQSRCKIRLPVSLIPLVYPLAGKKLLLGKHEIQLGIPKILGLQPADKLRARIVTIKGYEKPDHFLEAARRQLQQLGIVGEVSIPLDKEGKPSRKTVKIKQTVVGFTTEVSGLSEEDSLKLQVRGLGGRRHLGCGIFDVCEG